MTEFKKGDKVFVKPGEVSRYGWAPKDYTTPLTVSYEQHDGLVAVLAGVLEYSFRPDQLTPALDPSKVKAGDTVTVRVEPNPDTGWGTLDYGPEAIEVTGTVWLDSGDNPHGPVAKVGVHALGLPNVTITHHQPAPEPEPEWKPGTVADIEIFGDTELRALSGGTRGEWHAESGDTYRQPEEVTDVRPLVVIDPADVDVVALQREIDYAMPGHEASVVLERLGLNR